MKYDKILVKMEDKKECKLLKESFKKRYKVALYTPEDKQIKPNEDGMFETSIDIKEIVIETLMSFNMCDTINILINKYRVFDIESKFLYVLDQT